MLRHRRKPSRLLCFRGSYPRLPVSARAARCCVSAESLRDLLRANPVSLLYTLLRRVFVVRRKRKAAASRRTPKQKTDVSQAADFRFHSGHCKAAWARAIALRILLPRRNVQVFPLEILSQME